MSFLGHSALGVDVSDGTLKGVLLARRGRKVTLRRIWRLSYAHELDAEAGALDALSVFFRSYRPDAMPRIVISAPDRGHLSRTYLIPTMESERLADMVRYEVLSELGVPAEDRIIRWHVRKGVAEQQVHAYALDRRRVDDFVSQLTGRRLPFDDLETPGFALASFVEHEQPLGRDRVLLGVGELATQLVLLREDGIWTRHLPFGLQHEERVANLAARLAAEVRAAVDYLLPTDVTFRPVDVLLSEEGALDARFTGALQRAMNVPVTRFTELQRIATPTTLRDTGQTPEEVLSMGKAFGLALSGLELGRFCCPARSGNPRRAAARRLPWVAASLLLSALGLVGVTQLAERRVKLLDAALPEAMAEELTTLAQRAETLRADIADKGAVAEALLDLAGRRPDTHAVRRALAAVSPLVTDQPPHILVDSLRLAPAHAGQPGLITMTVQADPGGDESVGQELADAFRVFFDAAHVRGPQATPASSRSRWTVEVLLP